MSLSPEGLRKGKENIWLKEKVLALLSRGREATDPQSTGENTGGGEEVAEKQNPGMFCVSGILFT